MENRLHGFNSRLVPERSGAIPVSRKARSHRLVGRSAAARTLTRLSAQAPTVGDETEHRIRTMAYSSTGRAPHCYRGGCRFDSC